jgi:hypothetical protein
LVLRLAAAAEDPHNGERLASQGSFPPYRTTCQQPSTRLHIAVPGRRTRGELCGGLAASDRHVPLRTWVNGTLMALWFSRMLAAVVDGDGKGVLRRIERHDGAVANPL